MMSGYGVMCPGQGAQFLGMGKDVYEAYPEARDVFDRADQALAGDLELRRICFEGPEDRVNATDVCQPGILVTSLAILSVLEAKGRLDRSRIRVAAGLSLGEYTAHVLAGSLRFEDAVRLVRKRGQYMLDASVRQPSGMLSLLGADRATAEAIAEKAASAGIIALANLTRPDRSSSPVPQPRSTPRRRSRPSTGCVAIADWSLAALSTLRSWIRPPRSWRRPSPRSRSTPRPFPWSRT
jgi:malonyl CoA-acyl carrier protein transacylase